MIMTLDGVVGLLSRDFIVCKVESSVRELDFGTSGFELFLKVN